MNKLNINNQSKTRNQPTDLTKINNLFQDNSCFKLLAVPTVHLHVQLPARKMLLPG